MVLGVVLFLRSQWFLVLAQPVNPYLATRKKMTESIRVQKHLMRDYVQGGGKELDFTRYYHLLLRNRWLVVLIVFVALALTFFWLSSQKPQYAAQTVVQVENEQQKVLGKVEDVQPQNLTTDDYFNTVAQSFTSQTLMVRVARATGLDKDAKVFPPLRDGKEYSDAAIAKVMLKRISAQVRRTTRLVDITVLDEQPERAKQVAAAVLTEYVRQTVEQQYNVSRLASQFLEDEAKKLRAELETAEQQLQTYKERYDAVSLEKSENITLDKLKDLNAALTSAKDERIKLESDIEQVKRTKPNDVAGMLQIASVASIPQVAEIQGQIAAAKGELRQLLRTDLAALRKPELHPKYIRAAAAIDQLNDSLEATLQKAGGILGAHYKAAKDTEDKLTAAFHEQEKAALELNRIGIPYNVLQREVESDRTMYDSLVTRVRETAISAQIKTSPFRVVQEPIASTTPVKPEVMKIMLVALVFGLVFSCVVLVAMDSTDSSLRSVDQAEEFLGLPALGVIPEEKQKKGRHLPLVVVDDPASRQAEAFRFIRASISLLGPESSRRVFLMTSAVSDEGKSFSAMNMAASFAIEGLRTVVVEADLRRPTFYKAFPAMANRNEPGLSDYLSGKQLLDAVIRESPVENLSFIFAGKSARNPAELLSGKSFNRLIQSLLERFDRVICDSAPINAVSDTLTLIGAVQYVCLVVRPGKTPKKAIARACDLVEKAGGKIAGLFLNRVDFKIGAGYSYYYYGEKYVLEKA
jgi:polysaccharide biosynthesis transport protein